MTRPALTWRNTPAGLWVITRFLRDRFGKRNRPPAWPKGLAHHPIGVILLVRLAVDRTQQGTVLGKALLADALSRALEACDAIAARAVLVHAIDEEAVAFYQKFGFESSPLDPKQLKLLMKDLRATLKSWKS